MLLIAAAAAAAATSKYFTILVSECEGWLAGMSAASTTTEEDSEVLRDLVAQTLEKEGVLGKIKAQLRWAKGSLVTIPYPMTPLTAPVCPCFHRAHVYLSLEAEAGRSKAQTQANPRLAAFLGSTNGRLVASLVRSGLWHRVVRLFKCTFICSSHCCQINVSL